MVTEFAIGNSKITQRGQRVGMFLTKDFAQERIDLFLQLQCFFVVTEFAIGNSKIAQRSQRIGMFLAKDFASERVDLFMEF